MDGNATKAHIDPSPADLERAAQLVREKASDLNNALARAALAGLRVDVTTIDHREFGYQPHPTINVEIFKRL